MKVIVLALVLVAVNAAPPQQGPSLDVLPGVIIHESESSDQDEVPVSPHLQPQPQISPPRATDEQADSKPMTLPAYQGQPIPDDALPTIMREERQISGQNDVDGRLLTVSIGRPNYASRLLEIVKAGDCPSSPPVSSLLLTCSRQECDSDDSCHGQRKCCRYQCANICVNPVASYGYVDGSVIDFEGNNYNNYQKPGSCYRPGYNNGNPFYGGNGGSNYGRRKRQITTYGTAPLAAQPKFGYQQGGNNGGSWGNNNGWGNGGSWGNNNNGWGNGYQRCYNDRDCPGNQKCCNSSCRTPAFVG